MIVRNLCTAFRRTTRPILATQRRIFSTVSTSTTQDEPNRDLNWLKHPDVYREALGRELSTLENRLDQVLDLDLATALATIPQDWQSDLKHSVEKLYAPGGTDPADLPTAFADLMNRQVHCVVVSPEDSTSVVPLPPFTLGQDADESRWVPVAEHKNLLRRFGGLAGEHAASDVRCVSIPLGMYLSIMGPFLSHIDTGLIVPTAISSDSSDTPPERITPAQVAALTAGLPYSVPVSKFELLVFRDSIWQSEFQRIGGIPRALTSDEAFDLVGRLQVFGLEDAQGNPLMLGDLPAPFNKAIVVAEHPSFLERLVESISSEKPCVIRHWGPMRDVLHNLAQTNAQGEDASISLAVHVDNEMTGRVREAVNVTVPEDRPITPTKNGECMVLTPEQVGGLANKVGPQKEAVKKAAFKGK